MSQDQTMAERLNKLGYETRRALIENMAKQVGNRPSNTQKVGPQRALELWMTPTSPAAVEAFKRGATRAEAEQANAMWAKQMKDQGATDAQIGPVCRKFAWQQGKQAAGDDPKKECDYHARMAERANAVRAREAGNQTTTDTSGGEASDGSSD